MAFYLYSNFWKKLKLIYLKKKNWLPNSFHFVFVLTKMKMVTRDIFVFSFLKNQNKK